MELDVDFGIVQAYKVDRGFGFVGGVFNRRGPKPGQELARRRRAHSDGLFFHVSKIRPVLPEVADRLQAGLNPVTISFWYVWETCPEGRRVAEVFSSEGARSRINQNYGPYLDRLLVLWEEDAKVAGWLRTLTKQILVTDSNMELWERQLRERALRVRMREDGYGEEAIAEFLELVEEVREQGFHESAQVSSYIVRNGLGKKYQTISGWLEMENDDRRWIFKGGFPPKIYAMLCAELGLGNRNTRARAIDFTPFKDHPEGM